MVHADTADNNYIEEGLKNENMRGETENVNVGSHAAIPVHNAANPDGWQPELLEKGTIVYGHKSVQPLPEHAAREPRGHKIRLMADHGMCDLVARVAARGKLVMAKWLDDRRKNGMSSRLVAQQFNWAKRDDGTQTTPPLVAARLLVSRESSFGHKIGAEARCLTGWDCSVSFHHASLDEDIVVIPPKGLCPAGFVWQLRRAMNGTRKGSLAFGSVVTKELVAMPAAPFAVVVVAPMCFLQQRDRCGHDRAR